MLALLKEVWLTAKKALTTLSGVLISFTLQRPKKAKKLVLSYLPQQDLNGYSKPWLGGNGKNYLDISAFQASSGASPSVSGNVLTLTSLTNGDYKYSYVILPSSLLGKTVTLSCDVAAGGANVPSIRVVYSNSGTTVGSAIYQDTGTGTKTATFTFANSFPSPANEIRLLCYAVFTPAANAGATATFTNFMIEEGSTPTAYEPYENICAITGRNDDRTFVSGKNLLRTSMAYIKQVNTSGTWNGDTYSRGGIDWTPILDDSGRLLRIHAQGTSTATTAMTCGYYDFRIGQSVILNGCPANGSSTKWQLYCGNAGASGYDRGAGKTIIPTKDVTGSIICWIYSGQSVNFDFYPMLRPETDTDPTFAPVDLIEIDPNYGSTLYGGSYDIVSGKLADYYEEIDLGSKIWNQTTTAIAGKSRFSCPLLSYDPEVSDTSNQNSVCSGFSLLANAGTYSGTSSGYTIASNGYVYIFSEAHSAMTAAQFKTAMSGIKLVFRKKTPTITSKTAAQVDLNEGINNIATRRADDMTVVYESEE